jgi:hypothetical protein
MPGSVYDRTLNVPARQQLEIEPRHSRRSSQLPNRPPDPGMSVEHMAAGCVIATIAANVL